MKKKFAKKEKDIFEFKITFRVDNNSEQSRRHFLAHDAKEALTFFAHSLVRSLRIESLSSDEEILLGHAFTQMYIHQPFKHEFKKDNSDLDTDNLIQTSAPQIEFPASTDLSNNSSNSSNQFSTNPDAHLQKLPEQVSHALQEMSNRVEIIRFEEFNRWADRWHSLLLPLEEISPSGKDS